MIPLSNWKFIVKISSSNITQLFAIIFLASSSDTIPYLLTKNYLTLLC